MLFNEPMRVAIPIWQGRVSPVFDVARQLKVFDIEDGCVRHVQDLDCDSDSLSRRVARLVESEAAVLVCGAVSWPLHEAIKATGIQVIAQICGNVDEVAQAYASGCLTAETFLMPGCGRQHRRCRQHGRRQR